MDEMAEEQKPEPVSFLEMQASVGSILFLWSSIEREITKRIEQLDDGKSRNGAHCGFQKYRTAITLIPGQPFQ